jgi:hypothetical protein
MPPETRRKFRLVIAMDGEATRKELVAKYSSLWQAINAFLNLNL